MKTPFCSRPCGSVRECSAGTATYDTSAQVENVRQHHQKEEGDRGDREKAPPPKRKTREGEVHLSFLVVLSLGRCWLFPCLPSGSADFPLLPCCVVPFHFVQKKNSSNKLRLSRVTEVQFSSVEWRSLLLPFRSTAFLCLLFGWSSLGSSFFGSCCPPPPPPLGGAKSKKNTGPKSGRRGERKHHYPKEEEAKQHHPTEQR